MAEGLAVCVSAGGFDQRDSAQAVPAGEGAHQHQPRHAVREQGEAAASRSRSGLAPATHLEHSVLVKRNRILVQSGGGGDGSASHAHSILGTLFGLWNRTLLGSN